MVGQIFHLIISAELDNQICTLFKRCIIHCVANLLYFVTLNPVAGSLSYFINYSADVCQVFVAV